MPPFHKIFRVEVKIRDLRDLNMLMVFDDSHTYYCVPRELRNLSQYEQKLNQLEEELVKATLYPFVPSGHAFVLFDSVESA